MRLDVSRNKGCSAPTVRATGLTGLVGWCMSSTAAEVQHALLLVAHMLVLVSESSIHTRPQCCHTQTKHLHFTDIRRLSLQRVLLLNMDRCSHGHSSLHTCNGTVFSFSHHARLNTLKLWHKEVYSVQILQHQCEGNHLCYDE